MTGELITPCHFVQLVVANIGIDGITSLNEVNSSSLKSNFDSMKMGFLSRMIIFWLQINVTTFCIFDFCSFSDKLKRDVYWRGHSKCWDFILLYFTIYSSINNDVDIHRIRLSRGKTKDENLLWFFFHFNVSFNFGQNGSVLNEKTFPNSNSKSCPV